jgi:hypothetical protein
MIVTGMKPGSLAPESVYWVGEVRERSDVDRPHEESLVFSTACESVHNFAYYI